MTAIRRGPLATVGAWYRLLGKQQHTTGSPAAKPRPSVSPVPRLRRLRQCGRAFPIWIAVWYGLFHLIPLLCEHRWQKIGPHFEGRKWPGLRRVATNRADRPLLVALGSSRIGWALRSDRLNGMPDSDARPFLVYNFGIPSSGPISHLAYFRQMLNEGIRLRLLLIEINPYFLCEPEHGAKVEEELIGFESFGFRRFLQSLPYLYHRKKMASQSFAGRVFPWYAFRKHIWREGLYWVKHRRLPYVNTYGFIDEWGWHLCWNVPFHPLVRNLLVEKDRLAYASVLRRFGRGSKSCKALRAILELCRREKIPAALVWTPESSEFRSWYSEETKAKLHDLLDELRQTYGVAVIDATTWVFDEDFEDGLHVVRHGADVFTFRLRDELSRFLAQTADEKSD